MDLSDYYAAGYHLIRAGKPDWPQWEENPLLPKKVVSLSQCISPRLATYWGWNNKEYYHDSTLKFGIPEQKLDDFYKWCGTTKIDYPAIFPTVASAQAFIKSFELVHDNLYLIGAGLHKDLEKVWRDEYETWRKNESKKGVPKWIFYHAKLETGGTALGYEVASVSFHDFSHSWLCNDIQEEFPIPLNSLGLIEHYDDGKKVYDWILEDNLRAEPEPYDVWLLLSYPLSN